MFTPVSQVERNGIIVALRNNQAGMLEWLVNDLGMDWSSEVCIIGRV